MINTALPGPAPVAQCQSVAQCNAEILAHPSTSPTRPSPIV